MNGARVNVEDTPLDYWKRSLEVNLTGTFLVDKHAAAVMLERRTGSIVNIASQFGLVGTSSRVSTGPPLFASGWNASAAWFCREAPSENPHDSSPETFARGPR